MSWFKEVYGFEEVSPEDVRRNITIEGNRLVSKANGKAYQFGILDTPTLTELRKQAPIHAPHHGSLKLTEIVGDVKALHSSLQNKHALFQAASQFNLLEMVSPQVTPEKGITIYARDHTQGPACAMACSAGTLYRNYFVPVRHQVGQTADGQIDCLDLIGQALQNEEKQLWEMRNGYALLRVDELLHINSILSQYNDQQREAIKGNLKIGIQWNTEVTLPGASHTVSQAYCSALPLAYLNIESIYWERFARIILEATYEATMHAALTNMQRTQNNQVFLTLVGGGAFGNDVEWILDALLQTLLAFRNTPLEVNIVSYGQSNPKVRALMKKFYEQRIS